jgi:hypothetical protein
MNPTTLVGSSYYIQPNDIDDRVTAMLSRQKLSNIGQ